MSLSRTLRRAALYGMMLGSALALGGCSFSPVYRGTLAAQPSFALAYAKPNSRLEQIVYQELALRLGSSESQSAPLATVAVIPMFSDTMLSQTANPNKPAEVTVSATLTITPRDGSGAVARTYTRRATASYTRNDQVLADRTAQDEAMERAAKAAAESLRLAVLAGHSR